MLRFGLALFYPLSVSHKIAPALIIGMIMFGLWKSSVHMIVKTLQRLYWTQNTTKKVLLRREPMFKLQ